MVKKGINNDCYVELIKVKVQNEKIQKVFIL